MLRLIEERDISILLRKCEFSRSVGHGFEKVYWWEYADDEDDDDEEDIDDENVLNMDKFRMFILCY